MVPQIMQAVSGFRDAGHPAHLDGYGRRIITGEVYPGIFPCSGESVAGLVYQGLSPPQLRRLDRFESEIYERRQVMVSLGSHELPVQTYVVVPAWCHLLGMAPWELEVFERHGLARFLAQYPGFDVNAEKPT
jgi:hypothetical protein